MAERIGREMTLILTLGNSEQVIQISDRRLSSNGQLVDDESAKAVGLTCANARLAYGYTGLARYGTFVTQDWLISALLDCGPPNYDALSILERLRVRASDDFVQHPVLKVIPRADKRLSVLFSGYLYHHDPPLAVYALLTNYQDFESGRDSHEAWDQFSLRRWWEIRPSDAELTIVQRVGNWHAMAQSDEIVLRELLTARKPARAIVGKGVNLMREIADRPSARGTIGKQLTSIIIPRDKEKAMGSGYHTNVNRYELYIPDRVTLISDEIKSFHTGAKLELKNKSRPFAVPKVGRNHPCPCGSGKKYKYCHRIT